MLEPAARFHLELRSVQQFVALVFLLRHELLVQEYSLMLQFHCLRRLREKFLEALMAEPCS